MRFEHATHYSVDEPGETGTSRIHLKPDKETEEFKFANGSNDVKGVLVLVVGVDQNLAKRIEQEPQDLQELVEKVEEEGFRIKGRAYLGQLVARRGYRLTPIPEDTIVTECTVSDEGPRRGTGSPRKNVSSPRSGVLESEYIDV